MANLIVQPNLSEHLFRTSDGPSSLTKYMTNRTVRKVHLWMSEHQRLIFCAAVAITMPAHLTVALGVSAVVALSTCAGYPVIFSKDATWIAAVAAATAVTTGLPVLAITLPILVSFVIQRCAACGNQFKAYSQMPNLIETIITKAKDDKVRMDVIAQLEALRNENLSDKEKMTRCLKILSGLNRTSDEISFALSYYSVLKVRSELFESSVTWNGHRLPKEILALRSTTLKNLLDESSEKNEYSLEDLLENSLKNRSEDEREQVYRLIMEPAYADHISQENILRIYPVLQQLECKWLEWNLASRLMQIFKDACAYKEFSEVEKLILFAIQCNVSTLIETMFYYDDCRARILENKDSRSYRQSYPPDDFLAKLKTKLGFIACFDKTTHSFYVDVNKKRWGLHAQVKRYNFAQDALAFQELLALITNKTHSATVPFSLELEEVTLSEKQLEKLFSLNFLDLKCHSCTFQGIPECRIDLRSLQLELPNNIETYKALFNECYARRIPLNLTTSDVKVNLGSTNELELLSEEFVADHFLFQTQGLRFSHLGLTFREQLSVVNNHRDTFVGLKTLWLKGTALTDDQYEQWLQFFDAHRATLKILNCYKNTIPAKYQEQFLEHLPAGFRWNYNQGSWQHS